MYVYMIFTMRTERFNTLTYMQGFYRIFGSMPVGRLPGTVKGIFKSTIYSLER